MKKLSREFRNHTAKIQKNPETTKYFGGFLHTNYHKFYTNFSLIVDGFVWGRKRLSLVDKTALSMRENGFLYKTKRLSL